MIIWNNKENLLKIHQDFDEDIYFKDTLLFNLSSQI